MLIVFVFAFALFAERIHMMKKFLSWWFVKSKEKDGKTLQVLCHNFLKDLG